MGNQVVVVILFALSLYWKGSLCDQDDLSSEMCTKQETCGTCIQLPGCAWCAEKNVTSTRCRSANDLKSSCPLEFLLNPQPEINIIENKHLGSNPSSNQLVQIRPQQVHLKLRVGKTFDLEFEYKQALDYPVDLYYLMDLSGSMKDDKEKLSQLGDKLVVAMQTLTANFRIGFGSFVDKVALPFVSTVPVRLKDPCSTNDKDACASPYSFKNHMPLSDDASEFSKMVKEAKISGNLDSPEGGFDALMQTMVCTTQIGWRNNSRHLVVFSTDASFHLAGDGKLAGVVRPNDGLCHLGNGNMLMADAFLEYDYPSIAQLNQKAQENNMNLIFAVTGGYQDLYMKLQNKIQQSSFGILNDDSSNVIEFVKKHYEALVNNLKLNDAKNDLVEVRYFTKCIDVFGEEKETRECHNIRVNNTIKFTAKIKVLSCPADANERTQLLTIQPGVENEKLSVKIEIICDCPCEFPGDKNYEHTTKDCNGGSLKCGVCDCSNTPGLVGRHCECSGTTVTFEDVDSCRNPLTNETCSGDGNCECGQCKCKKRGQEEQFSGAFCECNNLSCPRYANLLCSGPSNGDCVCGTCKCKPQWTGSACEYRNNNDTCIAPKSDLVCSGRGKCNYGTCECDVYDNKARYSPPYCEDCPTCKPQKCEQLEQCVACQAYQSTHEECKECNLTVVTVDLLGDDTSPGEYLCTSSDEKGCVFKFIYKYDNTTYHVRTQKEKDKDCGKNKILAIVLSVTGSTVLIGLLLLIAWKVLTSIHDRREYVKFEKERALSKFDRGDNPLYKPSVVTFNNPTFGN